MSSLSEEEERKKASVKLKDEGNVLLGQHRYALAAEKYSEAIDIYPDPIYYSNRAQAMIKLESYGSAIADANESIRLDPTYIKAYYRRGSAQFALGKYKEAQRDFQLLEKSGQSEATAKVKACEKAKMKASFSRAIYSDTGSKATPIEIDFDSIVVESSYAGPRLPEQVKGEPLIVPMEFVMEMIEWFKGQKLLHRKYVLQILSASLSYFKQQPSLQRLFIPPDVDGNEGEGQFTVCGDTHGQFYDLCNVFNIGGFPSESNPYLFNGDYVDRGSFSFEVVFTLLAIKSANSMAIFMSRGNHETTNMNKIYGFEGEVLHKYDPTVYSLFTSIFNWLPLAAVIQDAVFVVHGGLTTEREGAILLSDIEAIQRGCEPPESGLMSDLLWADPQPTLGRSKSKRGVGYSFGPDISSNFLAANNLKLIIRSHEVKDEGYVIEHEGKCVTVFSAPNYCDQMGNKGAFARFKKDMVPVYTQYTAVPHPPIPPMQYAGSMMQQFGFF